MREVRLTVKGRVQGVNFRYNVKKFAEPMGILGFVRNLDNGDVEIVAQGSRLRLREFVSWIKSSPGFSKVEGVLEDWRDGDKDFDRFEILRSGGVVTDRARGVGNFILGRFRSVENTLNPSFVRTR
jgi:acylphosphatase